MSELLSFVICTYNPDLQRLQRVVTSIANQTVHLSAVELIVVDNRSSPSIAETDIDFGDLNHKIVVEKTPRLTAARIRGYQEINPSSELLIYVDDDNILAEDYAVAAQELASTYKCIGVFSSGSILPEYECNPPAEIRNFWPYMALIDLPAPKWGNVASATVLPMGAGMVVRREVLEAYVAAIDNDPTRAQIDRDGKNLFAGGDTDIGLVAFELGLGCGYFPKMKLTHVMPSQRLQRPYLKRLVRDVSYSITLVQCNAGVYDVSKTMLVKYFGLAVGNSIARFGASESAKRIAAWGRFRAFLFHWKRDNG